jgi:hypothetical protein
MAKNNVGDGWARIFQLRGLDACQKYIQIHFIIYYPKLLKDYITNNIII